jgi:hypothetical protein
VCKPLFTQRALLLANRKIRSNHVYHIFCLSPASVMLPSFKSVVCCTQLPQGFLELATVDFGCDWHNCGAATSAQTDEEAFAGTCTAN